MLAAHDMTGMGRSGENGRTPSPLFPPDSSHSASAVFGLTGESKRNVINLLKYSSWQEALVNELLSYVFSPLREGEISLYRGSGNGLAPILLVAAEETALGCVARLEHEYALRAELDGDWAARPITLTHYNDRMTLVLEDPGGTPLERLVGRPLAVSHFLGIAIPLAGALRRVHERGLIHKDIKPANILVDAASGGVWLTGFGIASRLPREHQAPAPPFFSPTLFPLECRETRGPRSGSAVP